MEESKNGRKIKIITWKTLGCPLTHYIGHRGLELDGAIGQGEICNSLKSEKFSKSFLSLIGKNKVKF